MIIRPPFHYFPMIPNTKILMKPPIHNKHITIYPINSAKRTITSDSKWFPTTHYNQCPNRVAQLHVELLSRRNNIYISRWWSLIKLVRRLAHYSIMTESRITLRQEVSCLSIGYLLRVDKTVGLFHKYPRMCQLHWLNICYNRGRN
jgi:hypothetical protein